MHEFGKRFGVEDLQVADFDGDLKPEILVAFGGSAMRLFELRKDGTLADISAKAGLPTDLTEVASVTTGDFDTDGDIDILALLLGPGAEVVSFINRGDGSLRQKPSFAVEDLAGSADAIVFGDFDNDGRLDIMVSTGHGHPDIDGGYALLTSRAPRDNNWLTVSLESTTSERNGLGARIIVQTRDGDRQILEQDSGNHIFVQDSPRLHFGLGEQEIDLVEVIWADGTHQAIDDVAVNEHIVIVEEAPRPRDAHSDVFDGRLNLLGGSGFTGTAGEVRVVNAGGGDQEVRVDVYGDAAVDMEILVTAANTLRAGFRLPTF